MKGFGIFLIVCGVVVLLFVNLVAGLVVMGLGGILVAVGGPGSPGKDPEGYDIAEERERKRKVMDMSKLSKREE